MTPPQDTLRHLQPLPLPPLPPEPLVSIVIPNYNYENYVGRTLESVLSQTYRNLEVIVCDDGSQDNSREVISSYAQKDPRITLVCQANQGQAAATNRAYQEARGEITCLLDADDTFTPDKVALVVAKFQDSPQVGFVTHPLLFFDPQGHQLQPGSLIDTFEEGWLAPGIIKRGGRWRNQATSALCFRQELGAYIFPLPRVLFIDVFITVLLPLLTEVGVIRRFLTNYILHESTTKFVRDITEVNTLKWLYHLAGVTQAVNDRIHQLKLQIPYVDFRDNLDYRLREFSLFIIEEKPVSFLLKEYQDLFHHVLQDDKYNAFHKTIILLINALAIFSPRPVGVWLLSKIFAPNPIKLLILSLFAHLRPKPQT
jgi:glycosyltransferase involved in cell wall biosynthesis